MKKYTIIVLVVMFATLGSWTMPGVGFPNVSSWSISIGEKELLASWKNNEMGDIATLDRKKLKTTDTLVVQRYLCGRDGRNATTTVTIKTQRNVIVKRSTHKNAFVLFAASVPLTDLLKSPAVNDAEVLVIYFTIDSKTENINQTELLGKLRIK